MIIYGDVVSGNCYKIKLTCHLLGLEYQWRAIDILSGEAQTEEFKALNPNAKTPFVQFEDGFSLAESNAIINYCASNSPLYPNDAKTQAVIQQWQFFEQYSHEPFIAVARFINKYLGLPANRLEEYQAKQPGGHKALSILEQQLTNQLFILGETCTTADISLFAYTHVADEGGFDLDLYPNIQGWIDRIKNLPGYVAIG